MKNIDLCYKTYLYKKLETSTDIKFYDDVVEHADHYFERVKHRIREDEKYLYTVCICVSLKYVSDEAIYNTVYCILFNYNIVNFNKTEIKVLKELDYRLKISEHSQGCDYCSII